MEKHWHQAGWEQLAQPYGRDYSWIAQARELFGGQIWQREGAASLRLIPGEKGDFSLQYGLGGGLTLHFLLESIPPQATTEDWHCLLDGPSAQTERVCIPVKSGRLALGWELGLQLMAIRPLAMLRPFYLFCVPQALTGEERRLSLNQTRRLGCLLDDGWRGIGLSEATGDIFLRRCR